VGRAAPARLDGGRLAAGAAL